MHEGTMVPTGGCMKKSVNVKSAAEDQSTMNMGDGTNAISNTCELREGDVFVRLRRFFGNVLSKPQTPRERLVEYNTIGTHNTTALGAADYVPPDAAAFLQKENRSQDEIPD
jgi:hypothetical protein